MNLQQEPYKRVSADTGRAMLSAGGSVLVDVRERDEYEAAHIDGAVWIPLGEIVSRHAEIPEEQNILLICRSGVRSGLAAEYLAALGVSTDRLFNVEDGVPHWLSEVAEG